MSEPITQADALRYWQEASELRADLTRERARAEKAEREVLDLRNDLEAETQLLKRAFASNEKAVATAARRLERLRAVEWGGTYNDLTTMTAYAACPECGGLQPPRDAAETPPRRSSFGHAPDCGLGAAIEEK